MRGRLPLNFHDIFDPELMADADLARLTPSFTAALDDLTQLTTEALVTRMLSAFGMLALGALRDGRAGRARFITELRRLSPVYQQLWAEPEGARAVRVLVLYILCVSPDLEPAELSRELRTVLSGAEDVMTTVGERLRQEGLLQGLQQGAMAALRQVVEQQLSLKFGELSPSVRTRLETAETEALTRYAAKLLTASTLEQVFESEH
jgi:hypothetical protein